MKHLSPKSFTLDTVSYSTILDILEKNANILLTLENRITKLEDYISQVNKQQQSMLNIIDRLNQKQSRLK